MIAMLIPAALSAQEAPASAASPAAAASPMVSDGKIYSAVTLRVLDKVTARSELMDTPLGEEASFGNLRITPRHCFVSASDKLPEQAVFLEVGETKPDGATEQLFRGWMFASSPALSALEHPVYDITMIACAKPAAPAKPSSH